MKYLALLPLFALAACNDVTSPVSRNLAPTGNRNAMLVNEKTDFASPGAIIACNGEPVTLTGTIHVMDHETSSNKGVNIVFWIDYTLSGIGDVTGARYQGGESYRIQAEQNAASVFSVAITVRLVAQGNIPNTFIDSDLRVTMNANGEPTVERLGDRARCQ